MLATLSTALARNRRQKRLALSCRCSHLEIAMVAVRAAESQDASLILTLDLTKSLTSPASFFVPAALLLARQSSVPVVVEVLVEPLEQHVLDVFEYGGMVITPRLKSLPVDEIEPLLDKVCKLASAFGGEVILSAPTRSLESRAVTLVHKFDIQAVRITGYQDTDKGKMVVPHQLQYLCKELGLPVLADEGDLDPADLKKLSKAGVAGVTIGTVLEEAFTAGLRTGLHNKSIFEPAMYLKTSDRAVEDTIINLFHYLKH